MLKVLLIKMSSMGDLVHNLPLVSDIRAHFPDARIDWVAEEAYSPIPALHPGINRVIPVAWRRWRRQLGQASTWQEMKAFVATLREVEYDLILDTQGLYKSAVIARLARGCIVGGDRHSIKEGGAALFYNKRLAIARSRHVIDRCRAVGAGALGYAADSLRVFGIEAEPLRADWLPKGPYCVLMHAASRPEKLWSEEYWVALGRYLHERGMFTALPWGSGEERARSERLAAQIPGAVVPPRMGLDVAAHFLAGARVVVGLDTGFTHFAAALSRPTIGIFCDSDGEQAAVQGGAYCESFGKKGQPPAYATILQAVDAALVSIA
ncbi:lipopolysaccharide heptosyltransferase I [Dechloromonas sp. HYN0024]|uniref:lipopolysaccharide heptosyltransferase I n=1 Tax=Dechloromonas sp. HYN0024 TaxID=2231055 RepID=UPI000E4373F9|nr:lipopolysaccharide heptosyltransferase I [Dechloromonas sp. HYN0024]AXS81168.1 lipopolysaccharide heptosyltransferase I [Dechloromonas sp. HYN0024]